MKLKILIAIATLAFCITSSAQQPVNNAAVAGNATAAGNGTTNSGTQRVTIASDSTGQVALAAGSNTIGSLTANQSVNVAQINGVTPLMGNGVTGTGSLRVTIASDNTAFAVNATLSAETTKVIGTVRNLGNAGAVLDFAGQNASSPANAFLIGAQFNTSPTTISSGNSSPLQMDSTGHLLVNCTGCSAGSTVSLIPATSGGLTLAHAVAAASTNATSLKASAGQIYGASIYNNAGYPVYLKFYNKASAPTVGTDTVVYEVPVQAGTEREIHSEEGLAFGTGIAYALTKGITDADTTAVALSDAVVDLIYK